MHILIMSVHGALYNEQREGRWKGAIISRLHTTTSQYEDFLSKASCVNVSLCCFFSLNLVKIKLNINPPNPKTCPEVENHRQKL